MDKQHIIDEILRTTKENAGIPLGRRKFENETGIKETDWYGKYWARWGDAVEQAGFAPNKKQSAYDENWLIEQFILLIREIKKFPSSGDIRLKNHNTYWHNRFKDKRKRGEWFDLLSSDVTAFKRRKFM